MTTMTLTFWFIYKNCSKLLRPLSPSAVCTYLHICSRQNSILQIGRVVSRLLCRRSALICICKLFFFLMVRPLILCALNNSGFCQHSLPDKTR